MYTKYDAIIAIDPNAQFNTIQEQGQEEIVTWKNGYTPIPNDVISAKQEELRLATQHIAPRRSKYPPIQDQLDMMYHDQVNGTTTWKDAIQAIKDAHPKN